MEVTMNDQLWGGVFAAVLYRRLTKRPKTLIQIIITGSELHHCLVYMLTFDEEYGRYLRSHEFGMLTFLCLVLEGLVTNVPDAERPEGLEGVLYKPVEAGQL